MDEKPEINRTSRILTTLAAIATILSTIIGINEFLNKDSSSITILKSQDTIAIVEKTLNHDTLWITQGREENTQGGILKDTMSSLFMLSGEGDAKNHSIQAFYPSSDSIRPLIVQIEKDSLIKYMSNKKHKLTSTQKGRKINEAPDACETDSVGVLIFENNYNYKGDHPVLIVRLPKKKFAKSIEDYSYKTIPFNTRAIFENVHSSAYKYSIKIYSPEKLFGWDDTAREIESNYGVVYPCCTTTLEISPLHQ